MSQVLLSEKTVYNPTCKVKSVALMLPICDFLNDPSSEDIELSGDVVRDNQRGAIRYREQILSSLGKDVLENGGEISINGNGDIILSFQSDDTYDLSLDVTSISEIDLYFYNISFAEFNRLSAIEWDGYKNKILLSVMKRYMSWSDLNGSWADLKEAINEVDGTQAKVVITVEASVYDWLEQYYSEANAESGQLTTYIKSDVIIDLLKKIKIKQMSIGAYTSPLHLLFGFVRSVLPYAYMKGGEIYSLCTDDKLNSISKLTKGISGGGVLDDPWLYRSVVSQNKKLMSVCRLTDVNTSAYPAGLDRLLMFSSPSDVKWIPDDAEDPVRRAIAIDTYVGGSYVDYNVTVNNQCSVEDYVKEMLKGYRDINDALVWVGTKTYKSLLSKSKYMIDYGVTIPISQTQSQHTESIRIKDGIKWMCLFVFTDDTTLSYDYQYFDFNLDPRRTRLVNIITNPIYIYKNLQLSYDSKLPILNRDSYWNDISMIPIETLSTQQFLYDETYIDNGFIKGDYIYMTKSKNTNSSGFIAYKCTVDLRLPYNIESDGTESKTYHLVTSPKSVSLHSIFNVNDVNDEWQIKDTINQARYQMLSQLLGLLSYWLAHEFNFPTNVPAIFQRDSQMKQKLFYQALYESMDLCTLGDEDIMLDEYLDNRDRKLYRAFARTFNIVNEDWSVFSNEALQVAETNFAYELRSFTEGKHDQHSYSHMINVTYTPINLPIDMRVLSRRLNSGSHVNVYFNSLVPNVSADLQQGGGLIAKKELKLQNMEFLKYIVAKSVMFNNALSNSELIRLDLNTMNTSGIDEYLKDKLPITRKSIDINLTRVSKKIPNLNAYDKIYLDNKLVNQLFHEYNHITQIENLRVGVSLFNLFEEGEKRLDRGDGVVEVYEGSPNNFDVYFEYNPRSGETSLDLSSITVKTKSDMSGDFAIYGIDKLPTSKVYTIDKDNYVPELSYAHPTKEDPYVGASSVSPNIIDPIVYKTTISGAVYNSNDFSPIEDATFIINTVNLGSITGSTKEKGMFNVEMIDEISPIHLADEYTITFYKSGYIDKIKTFNIIPDGVVTVYALMDEI